MSTKPTKRRPGRPKEYDQAQRRRLGVIVNQSTFDLLETVRAEMGLDRSAAVNDAIRVWAQVVRELNERKKAK